MSGFITLNRDIQKHWIYDDAEQFKAWCAILMACNWERREIPNGGQVTVCERGQCIRSLDQWAAIFGKTWNKYKVRRFFKLLESASMIRLDKAIKAQRLTVVNYDSYQGERNNNATESVGETQRWRNDGATEVQQENNYNNINNYNNANNEDLFAPTTDPVEIDPANEWHAIKSQQWVSQLKKWGCKIGANSWQTWQRICDDYDPLIIEAATKDIDPTERFADNIEKKIIDFKDAVNVITDEFRF